MKTDVIDRLQKLVEATEDLYDIQDHEDWCGHGKAGCVMCKVISKILKSLDKYRDSLKAEEGKENKE